MSKHEISRIKIVTYTDEEQYDIKDQFVRECINILLGVDETEPIKEEDESSSD